MSVRYRKICTLFFLIMLLLSSLPVFVPTVGATKTYQTPTSGYYSGLVKWPDFSDPYSSTYDGVWTGNPYGCRFTGGYVGFCQWNFTTNKRISGIKLSGNGDGWNCLRVTSIQCYTTAGWVTKWMGNMSYDAEYELKYNNFTSSVISSKIRLNMVMQYPGSTPFIYEIATLNDTGLPTFSGSGDGTSVFPYQITNAAQLNETRNFMYANYTLMNDINLSNSVHWNSGAGFVPIGDWEGNQNFTGTFNGQNYTISNLFINRPSTSDIGLFGSINYPALVRYIRLTNVNITGDTRVGALVGTATERTASESQYKNSVQYCSSTGKVKGTLSSGKFAIGGLVGAAFGSGILNSFSTCNVTGYQYVGGLIGYSVGNTYGGYYKRGIINNSYARGTVTATHQFGGGFIGQLYDTNITNSYSTGLLAGGGGSYGFGPISGGGTSQNNFWDNQTSGTTYNLGSGVTGKYTAAMKIQSTFTNWNFTTTWKMIPSVNDGYPYLRYVYPVKMPTVTTNSTTETGEKYATLNGYLNDTGSASLLENYSTGADAETLTGGPSWDGQTFTPAINYYITSVGLKMYEYAHPGIVTVGIRLTSDGKPVGSDLTNGTTNGNSLITTWAGDWRNITLSPYYLTAGTKYAIVARAPGSPPANALFIMSDISSPTYFGGSYVFSTNGGTSWSKDNTIDMLFRVYGTFSSVNFQYGSTTVYGTNTNNQLKTTGQTFNQNVSGLLQGAIYHYRTRAANPFGTSYGSDKTLLTKPNAPSSCLVTGCNRTQINLTWTNYVRSNKTILVRKVGSTYPSSISDGTMIYNSTGTSFHDTHLSDGTTYSYGFWSWRSWNGSIQLRQFSSNSLRSGNETRGTTTADIRPRFTNIAVTSGHQNQKIFFNVTYSDPDDGKPKQICTRIWLGTTVYNASMNWISGSNYSGAQYSYNRTLISGIWGFKIQAFDGTHWNETSPIYFTVAYPISFGINFPSYLDVGDYILVFGTLANGTVPLNNIWVYTKVLNITNATVPLSNMPHYVVNGAYMYSFSTSTMLPGIYSIHLNFTYGGMNTWLNQTLYLSYSGGANNPGPGHTAATLYYTFFNKNTGMQLSDDLYKMYLSPVPSFPEESRVKYGTYATYQGQTLYYQVKDYWNNMVFPENGSYSTVFISRTSTYIDIGISANEFLVKNSNDSLIYFRLTNGPLNGTSNTWYARWVAPQESQEVFMRTGLYNFTLQYYNPVTRALQLTVPVENFYIDQDIFYWVAGYRLGDIVISLYNVNSTLLNQLINVGVYVNNINSTVLNQEISSSIWLQNLNTTIANQLIWMVQNISNWNSTIKNQWIMAIQNITNMRSNITIQINGINQNIVNLNSNIVNQSNLIRQEVFDLGTTITTQINGVLQNITIIGSNITYQGNLIGQWIANLKTNITNQINMVMQQTVNINGTIYDQANIADQLIINSRTSIVNQIDEVWSAVNNTALNVSLNETALQNVNFSGFNSLMKNLRQILSQFQLPHSWQIPQINYTINDTTPPISTITAYVAADGSLQVQYSCSDNTPFGVAYVDLYYKLGNMSWWRNWSYHTTKDGTRKFDKVEIVNGSTYWFRCIGTDIFGNVEQPSEINTVNITYAYTAPPAMAQILPVDTTTILYIMAFLIVCIFILSLYALRKRKKEERLLARKVQGPRQPLR